MTLTWKTQPDGAVELSSSGFCVRIYEYILCRRSFAWHVYEESASPESVAHGFTKTLEEAKQIALSVAGAYGYGPVQSLSSTLERLAAEIGVDNSDYTEMIDVLTDSDQLLGRFLATYESADLRSILHSITPDGEVRNHSLFEKVCARLGLSPMATRISLYFNKCPFKSGLQRKNSFPSSGLSDGWQIIKNEQNDYIRVLLRSLTPSTQGVPSRLHYVYWEPVEGGARVCITDKPL